VKVVKLSFNNIFMVYIMNNSTQSNLQDPRTAGNIPPFDNSPQSGPGLESEMNPRPDFGLDSYRGSEKLLGRNALITGGDSGIGRAVALAFAREGANVAISYLNEDSDAEETSEWVRESGQKSLLLKGDIKDKANCQKIIEETIKNFGSIDILVNNAAYQKPYDDFLDISEDELEETFRVNIFSMFYLCQAVIPKMKEGSSIINTTSIQGYQPSPSILPYATTKGAIITFTKGLSEECIKKGIRVNAVAPGPVWTPLIASAIPEEKMKTFGHDTPTKRPGQPKELAPIFVLLASNDGTFINGEVIGATGGKFLP
jgi:NAD(P)-dependent dehydrogenase (short-subunit alcohol dehydrogenase family)